MKKRIVTLLMVACLAMTMVACGDAAETTTETKAATETTVEEAPAAEVEATEEATGDMISDESFKQVQDSFATLVENYNAVTELYNSDNVAGDADIEATLKATEDVINQMGDIDQTQMTEEDGAKLLDAMSDLYDALDACLDKMQKAN